MARQGRSLIYAARYETMNNLLGYLTENCCGGKPVLCEPAACVPAKPVSEAQEGDRAMKRLHVHVAVDNLETAIGFYSTLFAATPSVVKADYAKWMLDDPRVNFAISMRGARTGLNHLGIQVETESELAEVYGRLNKAGAPVLEEGKTTCCYAKSEKSWIDDPAGISWETFLTTGESTDYGNSRPQDVRVAAVACCEGAPRMTPLNVLFLCTGNSARSIMAESILRKDGGGRFRAYSAGSMPKGAVHPLALKVLASYGYPVDGLASKNWQVFAGPDAPQDGFRADGLRQRRGRSLPAVAGPAGHRALGHRGSGRRRRQRHRQGTRLRHGIPLPQEPRLAARQPAGGVAEPAGAHQRCRRSGAARAAPRQIPRSHEVAAACSGGAGHGACCWRL